MSLSGNASKQLSRAIASPSKPFAAVFIGSDELAKGAFTVKDLDDSSLRPVPAAELLETLRRMQRSTPPAPSPKSKVSQ
jgi:histidyl-tRNA synthetase